MFQQPAATDVAVQGVQADTVQCLGWSSKANYLAAGAWDGVVRCWEVGMNGASQAKAEQKLDGPVLDVVWHDDGSKIFASSCDMTARVWDLATNQMTQVAKHDAPIKSCMWLPTLQVLATGSWDKTLKFWDCRQPNPIATLSLPERCYAADAIENCMVVATADRWVLAYNVQGTPTEVFRQQTAKLKFATRCVAVLPQKDGFAVGTVEGRVGIQYFDPVKQVDNFTFKCHNDQDNFFCVNSMAFHPRFGTFATGGSDAKFTFWDKNSRMRLKTFPAAPAPINACKFNRDGSLLAYSVGYDWHKGFQYSTATSPSAIMIHVTPDAEIQPRPPTNAARVPARRP